MSIELAKVVEMQYHGLDANALGGEANILSAFKQKINVFASNTLELARQYFSGASKEPITQFGKTDTLFKTLEGESYSSIAKLGKIPQPVGMTSSMPEALMVIRKNIVFCELLNDDLIIPLRRYLGSLINNPDDLRAITDLSKIRGVKQRGWQSPLKDLNSVFRGGSKHVNTFGKLYPNKASFVAAKDELESLNRTLDDGYLSALDSDLKDLEEIAKVLTDGIVSGKYEVSKKTAKVISDYLYTVAKECEVVSLYVQKLRALTVAYANTIEDLGTQLKV